MFPLSRTAVAETYKTFFAISAAKPSTISLYLSSSHSRDFPISIVSCPFSLKAYISEGTWRHPVFLLALVMCPGLLLFLGIWPLPGIYCEMRTRSLRKWPIYAFRFQFLFVLFCLYRTLNGELYPKPCLVTSYSVFDPKLGKMRNLKKNGKFWADLLV